MDFIDDLGISGGSRIPLLERRSPQESAPSRLNRWRVPDLLGYGFSVTPSQELYPDVDSNAVEQAEHFFASSAHQFHLERSDICVRSLACSRPPGEREVTVMASLHGVPLLLPFEIRVEEMKSRPVVQLRDDTLFRAHVLKAGGRNSVRNANQFFNVLDHVDLVVQPRGLKDPVSDLVRRKPVTACGLDDKEELRNAIGGT